MVGRRGNLGSREFGFTLGHYNCTLGIPVWVQINIAGLCIPMQLFTFMWKETLDSGFTNIWKWVVEAYYSLIPFHRILDITENFLAILSVIVCICHETWRKNLLIYWKIRRQTARAVWGFHCTPGRGGAKRKLRPHTLNSRFSLCLACPVWFYYCNALDL